MSFFAIEVLKMLRYFARKMFANTIGFLQIYLCAGWSYIPFLGRSSRNVIKRSLKHYSDSVLLKVIDRCKECNDFYLLAYVYKLLGYDHYECISLENHILDKRFSNGLDGRRQLALLRLCKLNVDSMNFVSVKELLKLLSKEILSVQQQNLMIEYESEYILAIDGFESFKEYLINKFRVKHNSRMLHLLMLAANRLGKTDQIREVLELFFNEETTHFFAAMQYCKLLENGDDNEKYLRYLDHAYNVARTKRQRVSLVKFKINRFILLSWYEELNDYLLLMDYEVLSDKNIKDIIKGVALKNEKISEKVCLKFSIVRKKQKHEREALPPSYFARIKKKIGRTSKYIKLYKLLKKKSLRSRSRSKYAKHVRLVDLAEGQFAENNYIEAIKLGLRCQRLSRLQNKRVNTVLFYSYMALNTNKVPKFLNYASKRKNVNYGQHITGVVGVGASLDWWATTALGDYNGAYQACQHSLFHKWLNQNFEEKRKFSFNENYQRVLIIACAGVADEFRAFKYFDSLPFDNIEYTCDIRSENIYSNTRPDIIYHPVSQVRPGAKNLDRREYLANPWFTRNITKSIFKRLDEFDLILTSLELHAIFRNEFKEELTTKYQNSNLVINSNSVAPDYGLNKQKKNIGIVWRSNLINVKRSRNYFDISEFSKLLKNTSEYQLVSLEQNMSQAELEFCNDHDVKVIEGVDMYDDFDGTAALLKELDGVVGVSTLVSELASAVGTPTFYLCLTPEIFCVRKGGLFDVNPLERIKDVIAVGQEVVGVSDYNKPKAEVLNELIENVELSLNRHFNILEERA